jgi:hypothetical protein
LNDWEVENANCKEGWVAERTIHCNSNPDCRDGKVREGEGPEGENQTFRKPYLKIIDKRSKFHV